MLATLPSAIGRGLVAGLAGTAVMTAVQLLRQRLAQGEASTAPAEALEKTFDLEPRSDEGELRLANAVHWAYGAAWGVPRALLSHAGIRGTWATAAHFGAVWGAALVVLPAWKLAPPITRWSRQQIAEDVLLHAIYATTTGLADDLLEDAEQDEREQDRLARARERARGLRLAATGSARSLRARAARALPFDRPRLAR